MGTLLLMKTIRFLPLFTSLTLAAHATERWGVFELSLAGPPSENPYLDMRGSATDLCCERDVFREEILAARTACRCALQYYFEIETGPAEATLFPRRISRTCLTSSCVAQPDGRSSGANGALAHTTVVESFCKQEFHYDRNRIGPNL